MYLTPTWNIPLYYGHKVSTNRNISNSLAQTIVTGLHISIGLWKTFRLRPSSMSGGLS